MEEPQSPLARGAYYIDRVVYHIEEKSIAVSVLLLAVILITNVVMRQFDSSLPATEELAQFLMYFITFLGSSYAARKGMHIRMSILSDSVKPRMQKVLCIAVSLGTALILLYVSWLCYRYVSKIATLNRVSPILQCPVQYIWMIMPIGMFLTSLQYFLTFVRNITTPGAWIAYSIPLECEAGGLIDLDEHLAEGDKHCADIVKEKPL